MWETALVGATLEAVSAPSGTFKVGTMASVCYHILPLRLSFLLLFFLPRPALPLQYMGTVGVGGTCEAGIKLSFDWSCG